MLPLAGPPPAARDWTQCWNREERARANPLPIGSRGEVGTSVISRSDISAGKLQRKLRNVVSGLRLAVQAISGGSESSPWPVTC